MADEDGIRLTPDQERRRRQRSIAIAITLGALVVLFFVVTVVRIGGNIASHAS